MATATTINRDEFEAYVTGRGLQLIPNLPNTKELVYGKRVDKGNLKLSLRVYSSITPDGVSREVGADAIRVCLWSIHGGKPLLVSSSVRVHRVEGWRKNLCERLDSWESLLSDRRCVCGVPMIKRHNKKRNNDFYGCARYPECKHTENLTY